jgi:hypothetical protein
MALSALSALLTLGGCRPGPGARPGSQRAPQSQGGRPPGDIAFRLVVALAHATVDGADGASVTFSRLGQPTTLAASDDVVTAMDADQDATGEGPYVDTARTGERCHAAAPSTERGEPPASPRAISIPGISNWEESTRRPLAELPSRPEKRG